METIGQIIRKQNSPIILSPAGTRMSFLSALAAGADGIYCGLKAYSARMAADNFSMDELAGLVMLARDHGTKVFIALNTLLKPNDLQAAGEIIQDLQKRVKPDGLILQDLAVINLARQLNFSGELHLSTLANVSFPMALPLIRKKLRVDQVVIPRELTIDEIKSMAAACPPGLGLEVFVHGALCYGVSGRCYWSSFLGGKSGLRGWCVQPCRRRYRQNDKTDRFFSCLDLSLDVLVKVLKPIPQIKTWKIEGRKKGPHYVYYTTRAYRLLRDEGNNPQSKKAALELLDYAFGRKRTHYFILPQRPQNPIKNDNQTGSGHFLGRLKGPKQKPFLVPNIELLPGDLLRLGYEDDVWHRLHKIKKWIPKKGRFVFQKKDKGPISGTPVFLIDRREKFLETEIKRLEQEIKPVKKQPVTGKLSLKIPRGLPGKKFPKYLSVYRKIPQASTRANTGIWLPDNMPGRLSKKQISDLWWWIPPVIWPEEENQVKSMVDSLIKRGAKTFVLNAPWQASLFLPAKNFTLWAGPFCNAGNPLNFHMLKTIGFKGVIVSPELGGQDFLRLPGQSSILLGIIIWGNWPLCISRTLTDSLEVGKIFESPKKEKAWVQSYGSQYWIFPDWHLDLRNKKDELIKAGYCLFVRIVEPLPKQIKIKKRPGLWNWDIGLQ